MKPFRPYSLDYVYTGPDLFGTGTTLVQISIVFIRDLANPLDLFSFLATNWFASESDVIWNCAVQGCYQDRVNSTQWTIPLKEAASLLWDFTVNLCGP